MIKENPKYSIIIDSKNINIKYNNKEALEFRKEWLKKYKLLDSDLLFYSYLVHFPNTTSTQKIIDKDTIEYDLEIEIKEDLVYHYE